MEHIKLAGSQRVSNVLLTLPRVTLKFDDGTDRLAVLLLLLGLHVPDQR